MAQQQDERRLHRYARLAGFLLLFTNATAIVAFSIKGPLITRDDAALTVQNIRGAEGLFRLALASELITIAGVVALTACLYLILSPINRGLALIATLWRLMENSFLAAITFGSFLSLGLIASGAAVAGSQALLQIAHTLARVHSTDGFQVGFLFLGLGQAMFSYLWWKSRYIPRWLAGLGVVASSTMALVSIAYILWPGVLRIVTLAYMAPMALYEIGLGFWLLIFGIGTSLAPSDRSSGRSAAGAYSRRSLMQHA